jgi:hypothetical protein
MATLDQLKTALKNADAAGDTKAAKRFAQEIVKLRSQPQQPEPETFGQQVLRGAASTADIIAESVPGMAAMVAFPFQAAAGFVTGQSVEDVAASQSRVLGAVSAPVGRATGVTETPSYQNNLAKQALGFVAENMDKGADWISGQTGLPKPSVMNMMQVLLTGGPFKTTGAVLREVPVPGAVVRAAKRTAALPGKVARNIMDPKTKFYMDIAEGRAPELISAARRPEATIVPGARPTFAQATADVGMPRVAAVGEQAKFEVPGAATTAQAIKDTQEAARVQQLRTIERTPKSRARAEEVRAKRSDPLYEAAEQAGDVVDVTPVLDNINSLISRKPGNRQLLTELREVREGLLKPDVDEDGNPILVPRTDAEEVASAIDGLKTAIADEKNKLIKSELTQIKNELTEAIPYLPEAQAAFKKGSRTLNQRDMATYLREKLESPIPDANQRAAAFAGAVRDAPRTIKQALDGAPEYKTFTEAGMSKQQQSMIDKIVIDLSRDARVKELAQAGSKTAPKLMRTPGKINFPPFFSPVVTVANTILRRLSGKITDKMALDIALELLDADRAAAALETALRRSGQAAPKSQRRPSGPISRAVKRAPVVTAPNQMNNQENRNAFLTDAYGRSYDAQGNRLR